MPWTRADLLGALRSDTGKIIVRLNSNAAQWLILDVDTILNGSEALEALLATKWGVSGRSIPHPLTGVQTDMLTLSLVYDGETFCLTPDNADLPLPAFPTPTTPMTPKFYISPFDLDRDNMQDNVHPAELAAHDLFIMFAIMQNLPVTLDHLPLNPQGNPEDVIKLGIERLASIATYAEYYCTVNHQSDRMLVLKDLLFDYVFKHNFNWGPTGSWLNLLRLSKGLQFSELYIYIILEACQRNLSDAAIQSLTTTLEYKTTGQARLLLQETLHFCLPVYQDQIGKIVHIPLMGLKDYRAGPRDISPTDTMDDVLEMNAACLAGSIWESHMRQWAYWRDLEWRVLQTQDRTAGLEWRQRFTRYGMFDTFVSSSNGVSGTDDRRIVPDDTPDEAMMPGDIRHSRLSKNNYRNFKSIIQPRILNAAKGTTDTVRDMFDRHVVERYMDLAWEHDAAVRNDINNGLISADTGMVTHFLDNRSERKIFAAEVRDVLEWYVQEAAHIFRISLQPPPNLWDLSFTGEKFTRWEDADDYVGRTEGYHVPLEVLLKEEISGTPNPSWFERMVLLEPVHKWR